MEAQEKMKKNMLRTRSGRSRMKYGEVETVRREKWGVCFGKESLGRGIDKNRSLEAATPPNSRQALTTIFKHKGAHSSRTVQCQDSV